MEHSDCVNRANSGFPRERGQQIRQARGAVRQLVGLILDVTAEDAARHSDDLSVFGRVLAVALGDLATRLAVSFGSVIAGPTVRARTGG